MEYARIKANTDRAKAALQKIHKKEGSTAKEKIAYYLAIKEKFLDDKKDILMIMPRRKFKDKILSREFFIATEKNFQEHNIPRGEYEVETNG